MPIIYRTPWFYAAGLVVLIIALVYFGWLDIRRSGRLRTSAAVMWLLALLAIGIKLPSYAFDEIRVDQERMQWHVGRGGRPSRGPSCSLKFDRSALRRLQVAVAATVALKRTGCWSRPMERRSVISSSSFGWRTINPSKGTSPQRGSCSTLAANLRIRDMDRVALVIRLRNTRRRWNGTAAERDSLSRCESRLTSWKSWAHSE